MERGSSGLGAGATFEGRYEILAELGEGGFGTVYKARQRTTGQLVALKVMRLPERGGAASKDKRVARFLREARLCAELHHPNTVQLIDVGQAGDDVLYIVFAFAPGETLADLVAREGALAPREARHLMLQVLDALACAHAQGVVHRDLKPRNIMVVATGARRNALVLDFGIGAMSEAAREGAVTRLTVTGEALGTPGYAAPEQLRGLEPSPRADLFAWGLVFLECLTGQPVYGGASAADLLYQQLSPDPVPSPDALERHPLGDLLRWATRKDASERAATARELFEALERCELLGDVLAQPTSAPAAGEAGSGPSLMIDGERRQLTAVCCKLDTVVVPGTPAGEEVDELLRASLAICVDVARRHRAHVAAALGDQVLLYFGYPRADEDDARRAARAALAIAGATQAEGPRAAARLDVRIGVHAGLVIAGDRSAAVGAGLGVGAVPRTAARLATEAQPGTALVSTEARRLLRAAFELEAEGARSIEGIEGPVEVFRLVEERGERATPLTPEGGSAPLVGREHDLELLLERWRRTRAGAGQCCLITGEPGIGKSRLVRELRERLRGEAQAFLEARCSPDTQNNALYPVIDLLGRALQLEHAPTPDARIARIEARLAQHGFALAEAMPLFLPLFSLPMGERYAPLGVSPQKQKELTYNAILSLLFAMAEERPVVLLVEDLHWADPTTTELLAELAREAPSARLCVLMTARPELSPSFPTSGMLQIHLGRLERAQVEAMVAELLGRKALPASVLEEVMGRADGVPLFVEELTRMMIDSGALVEREDRYELTRPLLELEIPGTLRALLTARLDLLGRAKETAQLAAALGREFSVEALVGASHQGAAAVQEDLDRLMGAGLVFRRRRVKEHACVFKHALVRDAAYASLPREARRSVHARVARMLEERFPEIVAARPDLLARHHAAAEQKREAIRYAQRAASEALDRSAYVEATRHGQEALGWLGAIEAPSERADAELGLSSLMTFAMLAHGGPGAPDLARVAQRCLDLLDILGDTPGAAPALWRLLLYYMHIQPEKARLITERLLSLARRNQNIGEEVAVLPLHAMWLWLGARHAEARAHLERALSLYDPEAHRRHAFIYGIDSKVFALMLSSLLLWYMGYPEQALASGRSALAWAREIDHPVSIGNAHIYLAELHHLRMEPGEVLVVASAGKALGERYGIDTVEVFCAIPHAWAARYVEAARGYIASLQAAGEELYMTYWIALLADLEAALGHHAAALAHIAECQRRAARTGEICYLPELYRLEASYLLACGAGAEAAEARLRQAIAVAQSQEARIPQLRATLALARLLQAKRPQASLPDEARALLGPIVAWFTEGLDLAELVDARSLLGG